MTPRRFAWLLAARGPSLATWSPTDHAAAIALLRTDPAARAALAEALAAEDEPAPDRDALHRMRARVRVALAPPPPVLRGLRAGLLAACAVVGLYLGLSVTDSDTALPSAVGAVASLDGTASATVLAALDP